MSHVNVRPPWAVLVLWAATAVGVARPASGQASKPAATQPSPAAILQEMKAFAQTGRVLMVAAHPDDENTQLLTYLARGRHYATAYLSVTRGDGGQNVLGPEFGDELGWIRTQELLAARRLDGAQQFFTRARDFGFSKSPEETLRTWDKPAVLGDVVRVIRTFRPDVIVTRFGPDQRNTHGHHTASAILALEAFKLAADPAAYPEQLKTLSVWQAKRIVQNTGGPGGGAGAIHVVISGDDPVLGLSYGQIAARSRAMHKSQGFANYALNGGGGGARTESFHLLAGDPAMADPMDGVDTTWGRFPRRQCRRRPDRSRDCHIQPARVRRKRAGPVGGEVGIGRRYAATPDGREGGAARPNHPAVLGPHRRDDHAGGAGDARVRDPTDTPHRSDQRGAGRVERHLDRPALRVRRRGA